MTREAGIPRKIYVDHTHLRGRVTGLERVACELFSAERLAPHETVPVTSRSVARMILAQQFGLPARGARDASAALVFPGFPPGPLALALGERCLTYVHDTFLVTRRDELNWRARAYMGPNFSLAMRFGRRFFVNSRTTGEAVRRLCRADALVALLRPAVRDVFGLAGLERPAVFDPGKPLRLLAIGTVEPRKDYPAALALTAALIAGGMPSELHIVGRRGWGPMDYLDARPPFLTHHGYLDDDGLRSLAASCHALVSTSKAEGLGLPLLEIQHGGLPVIAPAGEVFSEVLADSALLITPDDSARSAARICAWVQAGGPGSASHASRTNLARWNGLAARDADRFRDFLARGLDAYAETEAVVPPC